MGWGPLISGKIHFFQPDPQSSPQPILRLTPYTLNLIPYPFSCIIPAMDLHELTQAMHTFVAAKGWDQVDSRRPQTPRNLAISLNLEASEVLEHFQWGEQVQDKPELASELADVALYLLQLASVSDIDLEKAILEKLAQNYQRNW
jgi:NTP pyrophosphatase (non-canonical NTP hydrolase)